MNITVLSQKFSNPLSICNNTKEFQYLLQPLYSFMQNAVFISSQSVHYDQMKSLQQLYALYQSIHSPTEPPPPIAPHFISWMQMPPSFIEFLSNSVDWNASPFQNNYDWLKPVLSLLKIHARVRDKIQTHCTSYQPFLNQDFTEHHYIIQLEEDHQASQEKKRDIFKIIQEHLKNQNHAFFSRSHISPETTACICIS